MFTSHFDKGDQVEVIKLDCCSYYPATVLRSSARHKNVVFVEYQTLFSSEENGSPRPAKCLREYVDIANLRPKIPHELILCFKAGDFVDAYCENAWYPGTIMDILEKSRYLVLLEAKEEELEVEQYNLRLHRKWVDGSWSPPLPEQLWMSRLKENTPEVEVKSRKMRLKIKFSRRTPEAKFKNGTMVEVTSNEEGYKGAWFIATVIESVGNDKFLVEYRDLTTDDGSQPLREEVDAQYIRPCPPQVTVVFPLREHQAVDAWYNEGWWEGVISKVLNSTEYLVYFKTSKELIMFENSKLRYHQDWLNGEWIIASKHVRSFEMQKSNELAVKSGDIKLKIKENGNRMKVKFCRGLKVEVRSDEEGYQGAWYSAIIIGLIGNDRYLVEYQTLKTDDETEQLKEEADATDIRPFPPHIGHPGHFKLHEIVDAWYNDGWWVGQVSSVLRNMKYMVHFRTTNEYLEFEHHELRPHIAWIQGEWVVS